MAKLFIRKDIKDFDRVQLEQHIQEKRVRRMRAALVYMEGKAGKLQHENDETAAKWLKAMDRLNKLIEQCNNAEERLLDHLHKISNLEHGYHMVSELIEDIEADLNEEIDQ